MREVRYTLTVYITEPLDEGEDAEDYTSPRAKAETERRVIRGLSRLDGDVDCECMSAEVIES